jgi:hypothetical protein
MEQTAPAGSVCVNAETWRSLKGICVGRSQGRVQVKGKGEQEIFLVEAISDC